MKTSLKLALVMGCLAQAGLEGVALAGYAVDAQISSQAVGDGTYNYTIQLNNESAATLSLNTFWLAWVPDYYSYDLLPSAPSVTQTPAGWYGYQSGGYSYYYPDGYSLEFINSSGAALAPGNSYTFGFNSPDSPTTLAQDSPFYPIPTLTSYVYTGGAYGDPGQSFVVTFAPVPEPATTTLMGVAALGLLFAARPRRRQA